MTWRISGSLRGRTSNSGSALTQEISKRLRIFGRSVGSWRFLGALKRTKWSTSIRLQKLSRGKGRAVARDWELRATLEERYVQTKHGSQGAGFSGSSEQGSA